MRILISSHRFPPSIGGIETVGRILAEEFSESGHAVRVVTRMRNGVVDPGSYSVIHRPSWKELVRQTGWADICLHNNISLQTAWPLLLARKPWVIIHHTWIQRPGGTRGPRDYFKRFLLRFAFSVSVSEAIAESLPVPSVRIPDPYDDQLFQTHPEVERNKDLIMVGRLVSDKGADVLLKAVALLRSNGLKPSVTLVGEGPERSRLENLSQKFKLQGQVHFAGSQTGSKLVELLNQHRILAVPSRWNEPFGLVALEGMACGCVIVGSAGGGLTEAIGPAGLTFPNNQVVRLTAILSDLLQHPDKLGAYRSMAPTHLQRHSRRGVARRYLEHFERCLTPPLPTSEQRHIPHHAGRP